jgi:hypothetical protein
MEVCGVHPKTKLQTHEIKSKCFVTGKTIYQDIVYCPECFEDHARTGKTMCMNINRIKKESQWQEHNFKKI